MSPPGDRQPDRLAHPAAARLRLRRAAPRHGLGPATQRRRRAARLARRRGLGLGRVGGAVPRVLGAHRAPVARVLRRDLGGAGPPRPAAPSLGWLTLRATRLPFLSATLIPVGSASRSPRHRGSSTSSPRSLTILGAAASISDSTSPTTSSTRSRAPTTPTSADAVQRRLAGHPVRARVAAPDGAISAAFYVSRSPCRPHPARARPRPRCSSSASSGSCVSLGLHGAAAEARLPRAGRGHGRARLRAADAARRVRRADRRRRDPARPSWRPPDRPPRRADPLRQRDPRPRGDARAGKRTLPSVLRRRP